VEKQSGKMGEGLFEEEKILYNGRKE
jgi:hypothetical protein